MSTTDVVRTGVEAFNRHDARAFAARYSAEAVVYDPQYAEPLKGLGAIEKDMEDFFRAFPDINAAIRTTLVDGATVGAEVSLAGTHRGPLPLPTGEVPATGKAIKFESGVFYRVNDRGQIVEERRYYDVAGQMAQLGLMS